MCIGDRIDLYVFPKNESYLSLRKKTGRDSVHRPHRKGPGRWSVRPCPVSDTLTGVVGEDYE